MAIMGITTTRITAGQRGNKKASSPSGVPGTSAPAAYAYVDLDIKLAVDASDNLYIAASNGSIVQDHMINQTSDPAVNPWDVFLIARAQAFSVTIPQGTTDLWSQVSGYFDRQNWFTGEYSNDFTGNCTWQPKQDLADESQASALGYSKLSFKLSDVDISEQGGVQTKIGTIYVCFPILYHYSSAITSAVTMASVPVSVNVTTLLPYYPYAIRKSGAFASCDRSGGSVAIRKSASWRDVMNYQSDSESQQAMYRSGQSWVRSPLVS